MFKQIFVTISISLVLLFSATSAFTHCEIPCGIYDDKMRITMLEEHISTIEKAMGKIIELENAKNSNQRTRWIMSKEDHANQFQSIVTQYFMTQRIKFDAKEYDNKLAVLHQMLVYAMKCKQTTDVKHTAKLRELVRQFDTLYFAPHS